MKVRKEDVTPCPFCGGTVVVIKGEETSDKGSLQRYFTGTIECQKCNCKLTLYSHHDKSDDEATCFSTLAICLMDRWDERRHDIDEVVSVALERAKEIREAEQK